MTRSIVLLPLLIFSFGFAQPDEEMRKSGSQRFSPISFEAIPLWSEDTSSVALLVFYRIHPEFFFFAKSDMTQRERYEAKGELVFEVFDEQDAAITREIRPLLIERNSLPDERSPFSKEITGMISFKLKKGFYKIVVEAKDIESGNSFINRDTKIDTRSSASGFTVSAVVFIEPPASDIVSRTPRTYAPLNRGGKVLLGQPGACLFQVLSPDTGTGIQVSWSITGRGEMEEESLQEYHGERFDQTFGTPTTPEHPDHPFISIQGNSKHSRMIVVPLPFERLEAGRYKLSLSVVQGSLKSVNDVAFEVLWPQKPHSLFDLRLAIEALRHIATEAELDSMTSLSSSDALKAFKAFWWKRNPDTTRAYNPAMAEYYRRVDETNKRFSSSGEMDGYRTDRGRIFILFGSPTFTNRLLKPNSAPTEIWTYEKLKRRFTFTDQRKTGNYLLTKMENY